MYNHLIPYVIFWSFSNQQVFRRAGWTRNRRSEWVRESTRQQTDWFARSLNNTILAKRFRTTWKKSLYLGLELSKSKKKQLNTLEYSRIIDFVDWPSPILLGGKCIWSNFAVCHCFLKSKSVKLLESYLTPKVITL